MNEIIFVQAECYAQETNGIVQERKHEGTDKSIRMLRLITVRFIWVYRGIYFSYICLLLDIDCGYSL